MKPLLNKISSPLLIYIFSVLALSIPIYYFTIEKIWIKELDDHNRFVAEKTKHLFNKIADKQGNADALISYWNQMQLDEFVKEVPETLKIRDSVYTSNAQQAYIERNTSDNFRVLITSFKIRNKSYYFRKATSFENTRKTVIKITLVSFICFAIILIGILILQHRLSIAIWKPFNILLKDIKKFNLNNHQEILFPKTKIIEFEELSEAVRVLTKSNIAVYTAQKEFTENASHELQTPLAIIKNKMDLLLQDKNLTNNQYIILEDMNKALTRSSRITKSLLLLTRIGNKQFEQKVNLQLDLLLKSCLELLSDSLTTKNISTSIYQLYPKEIFANSHLIETLLNNLLTNAIRHTPTNGYIHISLTPNSLTLINTGAKALDRNILFKRFGKQSASNIGSGLGLAIIYEICQLQSWHIDYRFEKTEHHFQIMFV